MGPRRGNRRRHVSSCPACRCTRGQGWLRGAAIRAAIRATHGATFSGPGRGRQGRQAAAVAPVVDRILYDIPGARAATMDNIGLPDEAQAVVTPTTAYFAAKGGSVLSVPRREVYKWHSPFDLGPGVVVASYVPVGREPGSPAILDALLDQDVTVLLPIVPIGDPGPLDWARAAIAALNEQYAVEDGGPFLLLHRARSWSEGEQAWIGRERKRVSRKIAVD